MSGPNATQGVDLPRAQRSDIQALRALAVSLVLVYHVAPEWLPGGFIGVDVFFVISGFLITTHLVQHSPRTSRDLAVFWGRRIRRLLPASLLVLAVTLIGARFLAPETQWLNTAAQARAAALYVVNWQLAGDAVDYLAAENQATAVQHFWSLSVEEQFYFGWPILILALALLARRAHLPTRLVFGGGLAVVVFASLAYSIQQTANDPAAAYFVTPTRIWELGAGGLLAVAVSDRVGSAAGTALKLPAWTRAPLALAGLVVVTGTAFGYSASTPFPGWQAAVPVLATVAVIAGNATSRWLAWRPIQWLGDVSYSLYLWHWPLVIGVGYAVGTTALTLPAKAFVVIASLLLAGVTKTHVEDRFRAARWGNPLRRSYLLGAVAMATVIALATAQIAEVGQRESQARANARAAVEAGGACVGAAALDPGADCPPATYDDLIVAPLAAANDKSDAYADISGGRDCWAYLPAFPITRCVRGNPEGSRTIALLGNSHAGQWLPALDRLGKENNWRIETRLASRCAAADVAQVFTTRAQTRNCRAWGRRTVNQLIAEKPDLVVLTNRISVAAVGHRFEGSGPAYRRGYLRVLERLHAAGVKVLVLRDTPAPITIIPDCVALHRADLAACDGTRREWLPAEPARAAVRAIGDPGVRFVDLTDRICDGARCRAVNGRVITYFDGSHLAATYAATLAPYLEPSIRSMLTQ